LHNPKLGNQQGSPGLLYERPFFLYETGNSGLKLFFQLEILQVIFKSWLGIKAEPVGIHQPGTLSLPG